MPATCTLTKYDWLFVQHGTQGDKIVIAMVGLPARGKTYIAHKLQVSAVYDMFLSNIDA